MFGNLNSFFLILFIICLTSVVRGEDIQCPENTQRVNSFSPSIGEESVWCRKIKGGKAIKHGPELIFSEQKSLISKNYYIDGQRQEVPSPISPLRVQKKISNLKTEIIFEQQGLISDIALHPNQKILVIATNIGPIKRKISNNLIVLDFMGKKIIKTIPGDDIITKIRFTPNGKMLIAQCQPNYIKAWNFETMRELFTFRLKNKRLYSFDISPNSLFLAFSFQDRQLLLFEIRSQKIKKILTDEDKKTKSVVHQFLEIKYFPDGKRLVAVRNDNILEVWNVMEEKKTKTILSDGPCSFLKFGKNGERAHAICDRSKIIVWNAKFDEIKKVELELVDITALLILEKKNMMILSGKLNMTFTRFYEMHNWFPVEVNFPKVQDLQDSVITENENTIFLVNNIIPQKKRKIKMKIGRKEISRVIKVDL